MVPGNATECENYFAFSLKMSFSTENRIVVKLLVTTSHSLTTGVNLELFKCLYVPLICNSTKMVDQKQYEQLAHKPGFIAALDQSGGSTPKALAQYGIESSSWNNDEEMFALMHKMRSRIITSPSFPVPKGSEGGVIAAILFERTLFSDIDGMPTSEYLWKKKGVVPIIKIDKGLEPEQNGVQLMKQIPQEGLDDLLAKAAKLGVFGTKERSLILDATAEGIREIVKQQFQLAATVIRHGLVPILEPEVSIKSPHKKEAEKLLHDYIKDELSRLPESSKIMLKVTIPDTPDLYEDLSKDPRVVRIVALSGGYSLDEACEKLARSHGLIASFSRALIGDLRAQQSDDEFDDILSCNIKKIFHASVHKV